MTPVQDLATLSEAEAPLVTVGILSFVAMIWCLRTKNRLVWIWAVALAACIAFWIAASIAPGLASK
jgi:hypothetical protein